MAANYDPMLSTDLDWVRFLIGDTSESNATIQDEEITALLIEESNKYLAAARAGEVIIARKRGVVEKEVDDLKLKYGDSPESAYRTHLQRLREKGCDILQSRSKRVFRCL